MVRFSRLHIVLGVKKSLPKSSIFLFGSGGFLLLPNWQCFGRRLQNNMISRLHNEFFSLCMMKGIWFSYQICLSPLVARIRKCDINGIKQTDVGA